MPFSYYLTINYILAYNSKVHYSQQKRLYISGFDVKQYKAFIIFTNLHILIKQLQIYYFFFLFQIYY